MSKLLTKARAGVTLVELLVVILIVTILSVSMLPLLQPFVTEAQYAAEAIPVIGNLRTKIGLYQYDKGQLPPSRTNATVTAQTWMQNTTDSEKFDPASYTISGQVSTSAPTKWTTNDNHIQRMLDVDYQDLKGKRSRPTDYQYYTIGNSVSNTAYVVACFGSGNGGLKAGTGYAVAELNFPKANKKYIATWKCYKPTDESKGALRFCNSANSCTDSNGRPVACFVPSDELFSGDLNKTEGELDSIKNMKKAGWEF